MSEDNDQIDRWAEDALEADACGELDLWLQQRPENGVEFVREMMLHRLLAELATTGDMPESLGDVAPQRTPWHAWRIAGSLAVALALIVLGVWSLRTFPAAGRSSEMPLIATLTWTDSSVNGNEPIAVGESIGSQTIRTGEGNSDFLLCSGATVAVSGEAELTFEGPMRAKLARGSARFDSPPTARGFTVILPNGDRVVDQGTAFDVSVDPAGPIEVAVTEGLVQYIRHEETEPAIHVDHRLRFDGERFLREGPPPDERDEEIQLKNGLFDRPIATVPADDHEHQRESSLPVGWSQLPIWRKARISPLQGSFSPHTSPFAVQFTGDPVGGAGIYQTVATVPGTDYELFYHLTRKGGGVLAIVATDIFDGEKAAGDEGDIASKRVRIGWRGGEWREQRLRFTARSEMTTIRFSEPKDVDSHAVAPVLDTVRLFSLKRKTVANVPGDEEFYSRIFY